MKIKSAILTQLSGSIGGMTGSHNAGGLYLRARTIPVNPASTGQTLVRGYLQELSTAWQADLTAAQRTAWQTWADNVPVTDRLGDQILLSGQQAFIKCNTPRLLFGAARVDDGPTTFNQGSFSDPTIAIDAATGTVAVTFTEADDWVSEDGARMLIQLADQRAPTINYFNGPYGIRTSINGSSGSAPTSPADVIVGFVAAQSNKVFSRVRVTRADGRLSEASRLVTVVTA